MSQLQRIRRLWVATISPFKVKSQEKALEQAKAKEIANDATAKEAVQSWLITSHRTEVKSARLAIAAALTASSHRHRR